VGVPPAVLEEQGAQSLAIRLGHLDELEPTAGREVLGAERRALRVPPGNAAPRLEEPLAPRPGEADREVLVVREGLGALHEDAGEPDVDYEHLFLRIAAQQAGAADEGNAELSENAVRRRSLMRPR